MAYLYLDVLSPRFRVDLSIRLPMDETRFELADLAATTEPGTRLVAGISRRFKSTTTDWLALQSTSTSRRDAPIMRPSSGITCVSRPSSTIQSACYGNCLVRRHSCLKKFSNRSDTRYSGRDSSPCRRCRVRAHFASENTCRLPSVLALIVDLVAPQAWLASLPNHLKYSEENLELQLSMFETSSNSGAWCYCMIHILHASCALGIAIDSVSRGYICVTCKYAIIDPGRD